jgi:aminoglycoside phosphotransferase (APT) family kinase protein
MLDYWDRYLDWATDDADTVAIYRKGLAWCSQRIPAEAPPTSLLWGDPQLVNLVLGNNGEVRAVLDWEMAMWGPAEVDLAWFLSLHEHAAETAGRKLPGDPGRAALIEAYTSALGRPVVDLAWYEALANIRSGAIVLRIGELMTRAGHSRSWTTSVPQHRYVENLIGA